MSITIIISIIIFVIITIIIISLDKNSTWVKNCDIWHLSLAHLSQHDDLQLNKFAKKNKISFMFMVNDTALGI
jgi:hypothetical protein